MTCRGNSDGFGLLSALFILIVMALLGAMMVSLSGVQRSTTSLSLQSARAYQAARSGADWGIWQVRDSGLCPAATTLALAEGGLIGFSVAVSCVSSDHTENGTTTRVFQIIAIATYRALGDRDFVRRRVRVTVTDGA